MSAVLAASLLLLAACAGGGGEESDDLAIDPSSGPTSAPTTAPSEAAETEAPAPGEGEPSLDDIQTYNDLSQDHVEGEVEYEQTPPVGGPHAGQWLNCGFYSEPVPAENAVHSMEHGAVWITYGEGVDTSLLPRLPSDEFVLVTPFEDLPAPVVASAWGIQLLLDGPEDSRLERFIEVYANGPQTPEPGAPCEGGVGEPEPAASSV